MAVDAHISVPVDGQHLDLFCLIVDADNDNGIRAVAAVRHTAGLGINAEQGNIGVIFHIGILMDRDQFALIHWCGIDLAQFRVGNSQDHADQNNDQEK